MAKNKLDPTDWEMVLEDRGFGLSSQESADRIGISKTSVNTVRCVLDAVRKKDWAYAERLAKKYASIELFEWAAEKTGVELPTNLMSVHKEWLKEKQFEKKVQESEADDRKSTEPASVPQQSVEAVDHWEEEKLLLGMMLKALNQHNELLEQLYDVVFPKWSGDVKDNVNVNCDLINQSLKRIEDKVEAIKINARRKGM